MSITIRNDTPLAFISPSPVPSDTVPARNASPSDAGGSQNSIPTPSSPPKPRTKLPLLILAIFTTLALSAGGFLGYRYYQSQKQIPTIAPVLSDTPEANALTAAKETAKIAVKNGKSKAEATKLANTAAKNAVVTTIQDQITSNLRTNTTNADDVVNSTIKNLTGIDVNLNVNNNSITSAIISNNIPETVISQTFVSDLINQYVDEAYDSICNTDWELSKTGDGKYCTSSGCTIPSDFPSDCFIQNVRCSRNLANGVSCDQAVVEQINNPGEEIEVGKEPDGSNITCGTQQIDIICPTTCGTTRPVSFANYHSGSDCVETKTFDVITPSPSPSSSSLSCTSLTSNITTPALGTPITFTCTGTSSPATNLTYSFRYSVNSGAFSSLANVTANTASLTPTLCGSYTVECRACGTIDGSTVCDPTWIDATVQ